MDKLQFEERIKYHIKHSGRSQAAIARQLKYAPDQFNKWIRGINRIPSHVIQEVAELLSLTDDERLELFDLADYEALDISNRAPTDSAEAEQKLTFETFITELRLKREFTTLEDRPLSPETKELLQKFRFVGAKWWSIFGFVVSVIKADGLTKKEIEDISEAAFQLNDRLHGRPSELGIPKIFWLIGFTSGGVICFVYEDDWSEELMNHIGQQRRKTPGYDEGITLRPAFQMQATSFAWSVDLKSRRIFRHLGKQPDIVGYHPYQVQKQLANLEAIIKAILQDNSATNSSQS